MIEIVQKKKISEHPDRSLTSLFHRVVFLMGFVVVVVKRGSGGRMNVMCHVSARLNSSCSEGCYP